MTSNDVRSILANSDCEACHGASQSELLKLGLLNRVIASRIVSNFTARASITNPVQIAALRTLVESARDHGWWDKCDLIYPFVGGTATSHAQNLKSSSFTITWNGAIIHNANGVTGDGAAGYGSTTYQSKNSSIIGVNNSHVAVYRRTYTSRVGLSPPCGVGGLDSIRLYIRDNGNNSTTMRQAQCDGGIGNFSNTSLGFTLGTRFGVTTPNSLFTGGRILTWPPGALGTPQGFFFVFAIGNEDGSTFGAGGNQNIASAQIGSGITFSEYQVMSADWQTFQTTLGRQV